MALAGLFIMVAALLITSPTASAGGNLSGDANCDDSIGTADALALIQNIAGLPAVDCPAAADVDCDGDAGLADVLLILRHVASLPAVIPGGCPHIGTPIDSAPPEPLSFQMVDDLAPVQPTIEGINGGPPRELTTIADEYGNQADFVANEVVVATNNPNSLASYIQQVDGEIVASVDGGGSFVDIHLIKFDPGLPDPDVLAASIRERDGTLSSQLFITETAALSTLAAAVVDAGPGVDIGINWVMYGDTLRERTTTEAATGPGSFSSDAYDWNYLNTGSEQDIGVTEAWTALTKTERLDNKSAIAVIDGGFAPDDDFPEIDAGLGAPFNRANPMTCSGGAACRWHGTNVVHAAMGIPDNGYGAAGPGGPVATAITHHGDADIFNVIEALIDVQNAGADIINMSFGADVPASLAWTVTPFEVTTAVSAASGTVIFASPATTASMSTPRTVSSFCAGRKVGLHRVRTRASSALARWT
ncbi:MAG TPA: S8 family serine peptidase [Dehalococcoidia bacterium]|nr:S8 family serine peptidase [Dehalococcoidia bacterium]